MRKLDVESFYCSTPIGLWCRALWTLSYWNIIPSMVGLDLAERGWFRERSRIVVPLFLTWVLTSAGLIVGMSPQIITSSSLFWIHFQLGGVNIVDQINEKFALLIIGRSKTPCHLLRGGFPVEGGWCNKIQGLPNGRECTTVLMFQETQTHVM